jgi:CTP synthase
VDEKTPDPVVIFMPEIDRTTLGGTMRLGSRATHFQPGSEWSKMYSLYRTSTFSPHIGEFSNDCSPTEKIKSSSTSLVIHERHRHRYEINPSYVETLSKHGMEFIGRDETGERMEIFELRDEVHPWFVGVQFHPEYKSRVLEPSICFLGFVAASAKVLDCVLEGKEDL